eukprot:CAMPEP_0206039260 /NCGR_PEP_ID=MMETSP1466-20131121/4640_1 /ASSEMBLY_ACC=CAM_ASM_001126 /TAXON_ID=44452 /ORGANISM="Pavlova gyrans, Strain CCMP608" /LENGTH=111 /DNA_ID=CAMNT_0053413893 /DNA_START=286 /DNA_END=620 /DNA_ORIENTATION=-
MHLQMFFTGAHRTAVRHVHGHVHLPISRRTVPGPGACWNRAHEASGMPSFPGESRYAPQLCFTRTCSAAAVVPPRMTLTTQKQKAADVRKEKRCDSVARGRCEAIEEALHA